MSAASERRCASVGTTVGRENTTHLLDLAADICSLPESLSREF